MRRLATIPSPLPGTFLTSHEGGGLESLSQAGVLLLLLLLLLLFSAAPPPPPGPVSTRCGPADLAGAAKANSSWACLLASARGAATMLKPLPRWKAALVKTQ